MVAFDTDLSRAKIHRNCRGRVECFHCIGHGPHASTTRHVRHFELEHFASFMIDSIIVKLPTMARSSDLFSQLKGAV
jgi:hypothetical protein